MAQRPNERPDQKASARQPTPLDRRIGALIRERRTVLKMRREDLSRLLGITPHQLQKYEVGENRIAASRLVECARALSVPVVWFYQGSRTGPRNSADADATAADGEDELVRCYRNLSPDARAQLIGIAKVMQTSGVTNKGKFRAP